MPAPPLDYFDFGSFRVDPVQRELFRGRERLALTPRAFDTLLALVEEAGRTVDKERLLKKIWPSTFVAEATLTQNVYTLRKLFERHGDGRPYIETLPRRGYRFAEPVTRTPVPPGLAADPRAGIRSLAVLPFAALSATPSGRFAGLGMADALITRLSSLRSIQVRPTSAVSDFTDRAAEAVDAGRALGVDAVIEGRVQTAQERLRVTVQLVRVRDGLSLWAESFDAVRADLLTLQDEISHRVLDALRLRPWEVNERAPARPTTSSVRAHQAYVQGRYLWNKRTDEALRRAISHFEHALRHDPRYALAHAGLADSYALLPLYGNERPEAAFPRARQAAAQALELDDGNAEAHTSLAYVKLFFDWDWHGAEAGFMRAIELDPGYPTAHHWSAFLHAALGEHEEAVAGGMRALELDPLSLAINSDLGLLLYFARRYEEAVAQFRVAQELESGFAYTCFGLALATAQLGRFDEAVAEATRGVELSRGSSIMLATLGHVHARRGDLAGAREALERLASLAGGGEPHAGRAALVYSGLGDKAATLQHLERACEERSRFVVFLGVWPIFDDLRDRPELAALLRRTGLSDFVAERARRGAQSSMPRPGPSAG